MVGEHLRTAAQHGFTERVRLLLSHGIDPNTRGYHPILGDQTAYELAVRNGHREAVALLAAAGGRSDRISEPDLLLAAALAGDTQGVSRRRQHAAALMAGRPDALRLAGEQHGVEAVRQLLELGYGIDAAGPDGRTALHEAALRGDMELCDWLLARGCRRGRTRSGLQRDARGLGDPRRSHRAGRAAQARRTGVSRLGSIDFR